MGIPVLLVLRKGFMFQMLSELLVIRFDEGGPIREMPILPGRRLPGR